jgi:hypothetical protein
MDEIAKAVKKALANKGIDVQNEYNKIGKSGKLMGANIPPNRTRNRSHIHKGILHKDHNIEKPVTKPVKE